MNRKYLLVPALLLKGIISLVPLITVNYYILVVLRCISGIAEVFYSIYIPVWCDQYGAKNRKTIMITIVQLGSTVGIIIGYGITIVL